MKKSFLTFAIFMVLACFMCIISCSPNDDDPPPPPPDTTLDISTYFPMAEGDIWYYTDTLGFLTIKQVSGDTLINSESTKRIVVNITTTKEAWSKDSSAFYIHLLEGNVEFQPPLEIPFNIVDQPYNFGSKVIIYLSGNTFGDTTYGTLSFVEFDTMTVTAGLFDSVMTLYYDQTEPDDQYYEYYARNVGLIDNGFMQLDSAHVGGVWYRPTK
ncbi:MAG: hypothetical protein ABIJ45_05480 [Candidatus Zixiibacteriota bacterium]